nr:calmodulin [Hymenolepis microstoma]
MTSYKLTEEDIAEFYEAFTSFDKDGNGLISRSELDDIVRSLGQNPTQGDIKKMMDEVDVDGNGAIDWNEFLKLMEKKLQDCEPERELKEAFQVFDMDGDGYISHVELRRAMETFGERVSGHQSREMIKHADIDGDGQVDYEEFVKTMMGI